MELGSATATLHQLQEGQEQTRQQLQQLLYERDLLLDELCKTGSVSEQIRWEAASQITDHVWAEHETEFLVASRG